MSEVLKPKREYEVGYGKPPKWTQFQKGKSPNPAGRPKQKRAGEIDIAGVLGAPVKVRRNGRLIEMNPFEASIRVLAQKAINGNVPAAKRLLKLAEKYDVLRKSVFKGLTGVVQIPSKQAEGLRALLAEEQARETRLRQNSDENL